MSYSDETKEQGDLLQESSDKMIPSKNKMLNMKLIFAAIITVIGSSFQFGYNTGVVNNGVYALKQFINTSYYHQYEVEPSESTINLIFSTAVSIFAIGGMIGSFFVGFFADKFGRKRSMLVNNILVVIAVGLVILSNIVNTYQLLIISRFIFGVNCGLNTALAPMYLTEIAPIKLRGAFGALNQMGIVTSILFSQILGLPAVFGSNSQWVLLLGVPLVFATIQALCLPFCPETPAYLVQQNKTDEAYVALKWFRGSDNVDVDIKDIKAQQEKSQQQQLVGISELISNNSLRRALIVAVVMQLSQQLSGINAVLYYSADMFLATGISENQTTLITLGVGIANVVMCIVSIPLMEMIGRRSLHLFGLIGMTFCAIVLTITLELSSDFKWAAIVAVVAVLLFVIFFQSGPGSIPWFITAEIFNQSARPAAVSVAGLVNWTGNFVVGIGYLPLKDLIGGYTFGVFSALLIFFCIFTYFKVPETKGKGIDEISRLFDRDRDQSSI